MDIFEAKQGGEVLDGLLRGVVLLVALGQGANERRKPVCVLQTSHLLGELVVRGYRTLVGGDTSAGKTTFTLALLAAILKGEEFLGFQGSGGARALVVDLEQGLRSVKRRLREAGLDESEGIRVGTVIREVPDGNWGAAGQQVRYQQLVEAAAAEREKAGAPA